jgi:hypothetical protein
MSEYTPKPLSAEEVESTNRKVVQDTAMSLEPPKPERAMSVGVISVTSGNRKLNIRAKPYAEAMIVCALPSGTEVIVDGDASTDDFYSVYTEAGVSGYCMKQYVTIQE